MVRVRMDRGPTDAPWQPVARSRRGPKAPTTKTVRIPEQALVPVDDTPSYHKFQLFTYDPSGRTVPNTLNRSELMADALRREGMRVITTSEQTIGARLLPELQPTIDMSQGVRCTMQALTTILVPMAPASTRSRQRITMKCNFLKGHSAEGSVLNRYLHSADVLMLSINEIKWIPAHVEAPHLDKGGSTVHTTIFETAEPTTREEALRSLPPKQTRFTGGGAVMIVHIQPQPEPVQEVAPIAPDVKNFASLPTIKPPVSDAGSLPPTVCPSPARAQPQSGRAKSYAQMAATAPATPAGGSPPPPAGVPTSVPGPLEAQPAATDNRRPPPTKGPTCAPEPSKPQLPSAGTPETRPVPADKPHPPSARGPARASGPSADRGATCPPRLSPAAELDWATAEDSDLDEDAPDNAEDSGVDGAASDSAEDMGLDEDAPDNADDSDDERESAHGHCLKRQRTHNPSDQK